MRCVHACLSLTMAKKPLQKTAQATTHYQNSRNLRSSDKSEREQCNQTEKGPTRSINYLPAGDVQDPDGTNACLTRRLPVAVFVYLIVSLSPTSHHTAAFACDLFTF